MCNSRSSSKALRGSSSSKQAARDLLISDQVAKGFELLSNKEKISCSGSAASSHSNTSQEYYRPVLEALCAFVRDQTKTRPGDEPPASDVQAALTAIGRRVAGEARPNLQEARIPKADQARADLSYAVLNDAFLSGANLRGADLSDANLRGADLSGVNLSKGAFFGAPAT